MLPQFRAKKIQKNFYFLRNSTTGSGTLSTRSTRS